MPKKKTGGFADWFVAVGLEGKEGRVQEEGGREEGAEDRDVRLLSKELHYYWELSQYVYVYYWMVG